MGNLYRKRAFTRDNFLYQKDFSAWHSKQLFTMFTLFIFSWIAFLPSEAPDLSPPLQSGWYISLNYQIIRGVSYFYGASVSRKFGFLLICLMLNYFLGKLKKLTTSLVAQMVKRLSTMQETRVWSLGQEDPLEKEMAIHSSTIAWKIPWTEELGRLQSTGLQRVGHNWATSL